MSKSIRNGADDTLFTAGEQTEANIEALKPHPRNGDIYTDRDNADLVARIENHGFRESQRILIAEEGTILSGHRRTDAAEKAGLETVPVEVADVDPESDEALLELLTANEHREKTPAEQINEAQMWEEIEEALAEERSKNPRQNFARGETGRSAEKAAQKIGASRETYRKGKYVKEKAQNGMDVAQDQWELLETDDQSIHGAYTTVRDVVKADEEDTDDTSSEDESTSDDSDAVEEAATETEESDEYAGPGPAEAQDVNPDAEELFDTGSSETADSSSGEQPSADEGTIEDGEDPNEETAATIQPAGSEDVGAKPPENMDKTTANAISRQHELEEENEELRKRIEYLREGSKRQAARIDEYREQALSAKMDAPDVDAVEQAKAHVDVAAQALPKTPIEDQNLTQEDLNDKVSKATLQLEDAQQKLEGQL